MIERLHKTISSKKVTKRVLTPTQIAVALCVLVIVACSPSGDSNDASGPEDQAPRLPSQLTTPPTADTSQGLLLPEPISDSDLAAVQNQLAEHLIGHSSTAYSDIVEVSNIVIDTKAIGKMLSLLYQAADGETRESIDAALSFIDANALVQIYTAAHESFISQQSCAISAASESSGFIDWLLTAQNAAYRTLSDDSTLLIETRALLETHALWEEQDSWLQPWYGLQALCGDYSSALLGILSPPTGAPKSYPLLSEQPAPFIFRRLSQQRTGFPELARIGSGLILEPINGNTAEKALFVFSDSNIAHTSDPLIKASMVIHSGAQIIDDTGIKTLLPTTEASVGQFFTGVSELGEYQLLILQPEPEYFDAYRDSIVQDLAALQTLALTTVEVAIPEQVSWSNSQSLYNLNEALGLDLARNERLANFSNLAGGYYLSALRSTAAIELDGLHVMGSSNSYMALRYSEENAFADTGLNARWGDAGFEVRNLILPFPCNDIEAELLHPMIFALVNKNGVIEKYAELRKLTGDAITRVGNDCAIPKTQWYLEFQVGAVQCEPPSVTVAEGEQQLRDQGLDIVDAQCSWPSDIVVPTVCGARDLKRYIYQVESRMPPVGTINGTTLTTLNDTEGRTLYDCPAN